MERTGFMNKFAVLVEDTRCSKSRLRSGFLKKEALVVAASHFQMLLSSLTLGVFAVPCASICYSSRNVLCSWFQPLLLLIFAVPVTVGIAFIRPYDAPLRQNLELSAGLLDCMTLTLALLRSLFPFKGAGGAIAVLQIIKVWLQVLGVWKALYLSVRLHGVGVCMKRKPYMEAIILKSVRQNAAKQHGMRSARARLRTTVGGRHQDFSITWNGHAGAAPLPSSRPSRSSIFEEDMGTIFEDDLQVGGGESSPECAPAGLFMDDGEERGTPGKGRAAAVRKSVVVVKSTKKNPLADAGGGNGVGSGLVSGNGEEPKRKGRGGRLSVSNPLATPSAGSSGARARRGKRESVSNPLMASTPGEDPASGAPSSRGAPRASVVVLGPNATQNPLSAARHGEAPASGKRRGAGRPSVVQPNPSGGPVTLKDTEGLELVCTPRPEPPVPAAEEPAVGGFFLTAADAALGLDDPPPQGVSAQDTDEKHAEETAPKRLLSTFSQMSSVMDRLAKLKARRAAKKNAQTSQGGGDVP